MTYFAFLKGINVGGNHIIKMAELKALFENLGLKNVRTFIQSGNVVFESPAKADVLKKKIESRLEKAAGYKIVVVLRTKDEMEKIISGYPFSKIKGHTECKLNVGFLECSPEKNSVKELEVLNSDKEMFLVKGDNLYHLCKLGFAESLAGKNIFEKKLKVKVTVRNWNTVNKVLNI
ncbi:MAG: DUF1697 domain-containing protein [Chitinophagales bacterium]